MKLCVVTQQILKCDVLAKKGTTRVIIKQIIKLGHDSDSENTTSLTRYHYLVTLLFHIPNNFHIFR